MRALIGLPSSSSGPQPANSATFPRRMTRGRSAAAQRTTTQASERIFCFFGLPLLATEKSVQSGEAQRSPTGRPPVASSGFTSQMSAVRWSVPGWFALWAASAIGS